MGHAIRASSPNPSANESMKMIKLSSLLFFGLCSTLVQAAPTAPRNSPAANTAFLRDVRSFLDF